MLNKTTVNRYKIPVLFTCTLIAFYSAFAYDLIRTDYIKLILLYAGLFYLSYKLIQIEKNNIRFLVIISVVFRLLFIVATPNLSQDFFRFIWDGRMILEGFNPYLHTPDSFITKEVYPINQAETLYNGMGTLSASHYTNYPPISQFCYSLAAWFSNQSILGAMVILRLILILADLGTLYFGSKLLKALNLPQYRIFWYILNPFILIEFTGNLHFEGLMICFLVMSLYFLKTSKLKTSALFLGLSVATKLIPLIFLPLFLKHLKWKKGLLFCFIVMGLNIVLFLPFFSTDFLNNYSETIGLWFVNFEFNASLFNIAQAIGYAVTDHNMITLIGPVMAILTILFIIYTTLKKSLKTTTALITAMLIILTVYYFMSTTVHPWYITTLVMLAVFTNYKFPLVWSVVIVLSYLAYANTDNAENLWIISIEYLAVYGVFIYEVFLKKPVKNI